MLSDVVVFITDGALEPEVALQMARVIGSSLERIASTLVDTIETRRHVHHEAEDADPDADGALADEGGRLWDADGASALARWHGGGDD